MGIDEVISYLVEQGPGEDWPETETDNKVVPRKEGLMGMRLSRIMQERFRRNHDDFMVFTGHRYERYEAKVMYRVIRGFLERMGVSPCYMALGSIKRMYEMVLSDPGMKSFEPRRNVVYMANCVLVVNSDGSVLREQSSPEWMTNIYLDFPYIPDAACPNWERFLETVLDDSNARRVLQEFLGCMFIDKDVLSIEKSLFLYGHGSNGKSVVYETMAGMLGDNVTNVGLEQLNGSSGDYFTAKCVGKLLAYNSDAEPKDISSGKYKQLISKERISVRQIYKDAFETDDWPMFMANINKAIITTDSSDGFWRRNIVIGFFKVFSDNPDVALGQLKADRSFKTSMRSEYPGIFNWIMEGRRRIIEQRGVFTRSRSVEELTADMRNYSNSVYMFLHTMGYAGRKPGPGEGMFYIKKSFVKELYDEYYEWCSQNGYGERKNISRFKEDVVNAGITWVRAMKKEGKVSTGFIYYEVPLREEEDAGEMYEEAEDMPLFD